MAVEEAKQMVVGVVVDSWVVEQAEQRLVEVLVVGVGVVNS